MKTQISRKTFDAEKRYSGIYQQMGRMLTDADWNELSDMEKNRLAQALTDVIGNGTPRHRGIVESTVNPDNTTSYTLKWGYAYVDGISAQVRPATDAVLADPTGEAFEYEHQADFPLAPAPIGNHRLYLDIWERTVTTLEDGDLRDAGLHGADTCTRTQTMAQVKWCPSSIDPEDHSQNPSIGAALLSVDLRTGSTEPDPCDPCAEEIALQDKVGNYLFRMEIHDVIYDGTGEPERVTLKWSSENGAEQYVVGEGPAGFESSHWSYEFFNGAGQNFASEKHLGRHLATGFSPSRGELTQGYPDPVPPGHDLVRRWDGHCTLDKSGSDWVLVEGSDLGVSLSTSSEADAHGHITTGSTVTIKLDSLTVAIQLADLPLLAGDFWQTEIRQAIHVAGDNLLTDKLPCGIEHHYMCLGSVIAGVFTPCDTFECQRFEFPPLTDIWAKNVCYNNDACSMPEVDNVQQAIDYLCQQKDLRWHHKHLHGWGIVCGLIAECCPEHSGGDETVSDEVDVEAEETTRRTVCVTAGHALTCEGETLSLEQQRIVAVMDQIESLEAAGESILSDGNGSVCLRMDPGPDGQPEFRVEAYDSNTHKNSMFDGTILMDFYQNCILDLVEAIRGEFSFLNASELDVVEGGSTGLVSTQRRKLTSLLNLIIQLFNSGNGSYVFLSRKEHLILRDVYLRLRDLLKSKTFCAMFQDNEFPDYPFDESGMSTVFGKNNHTRVQLHPSGERVYTYGGTDSTINIYDSNSEELIEVLEMPSAEGAEVTAIAFTPNGELMFAAASVRQTDTVFGVARVTDNHSWEDMTILCDIQITEMSVSPNDQGLIYALGLGRGLFFLRPDVFADDTKPQPTPTYAFNASGHMVIDFEQNLAYCTAQSNAAASADNYNQVAVCNLSSNVDNQTPTVSLSLADAAGNNRTGRDDIAMRSGEGGRLFVVVDGGNNSKQLLTYTTPLSTNQQPIAGINIEDTDVSLAYHREQDRLLVALEDGYRIQVVNQNGEATNVFRVPVQIQPVDVVVDSNNGQIYALNFISNTLSVIPGDELEVSTAFLDSLSTYRTEILLAFYGLFGGLLQYLKDCFCHHLLVKCPTCDDEDVLYLATVEIRDNEVYKICNFDKRKYVKSFPTMGYWFSMIPLWPMLKSVVSQFCCAVLPDFFGQYRDNLIRQPESAATSQEVQSNFIKANTARGGVQTYQRTDTKMILRNQGKSLNFTGTLARDGAANFIRTNQSNQAGVRKQVLMQSNTNDAVAELERNQIAVAEVQQYDASKANTYLADFSKTPQRIDKGSEVTLVEKDGRVVYYAVKQPQTTAVITEVPDNVRAEIQNLENRKSALADFSNVDAELARVEARRESLVELESVRTELTGLQAERATAEAELAALRSQVESIQTTRAEEEVRLAEINTQREALAADINSLSTNLNQLSDMRREITVEVERSRPVTDMTEVSTEVDVELRELGIRTVDELSRANVADLTVSTRIDNTTAENLITAANRRISINRT